MMTINAEKGNVLGLKFKLMEKNVKKYMPQKEGPKYSSTETRLIVQIERNSKKKQKREMRRVFGKCYLLQEIKQAEAEKREISVIIHWCAYATM
jgi:hypothetical protein